MRTTRPEIDDVFLEALRDWVLWLNSGQSPAPRSYQLAGIERNAKSGGERDYIAEEFDVKRAVMVNDGYLRLALPERNICRIHLMWSAANPIDGPNPTEEWPSARKREAAHANMTQEAYETALQQALHQWRLSVAV